MSLLGTPVVLVTPDGLDGHESLTVSAISSASKTSQAVLVCLNRSNRSHLAFLKNGVIGNSALSPEHQDLTQVFACRSVGSTAKFARDD